MRTGIAIAAGVLLFAAALAITAPAGLLDARVAALSGGQARIADAEGTLWSGSGELVLPGAVRRPLVWRIEALPLLRGELRATLSGEAGAARRGVFAYGHDRLELRELDLSLPMESLLRAAGAPAAFAAAGGRVEAHVERLVQAPDAIDAQLAVLWHDASLPGPRPELRVALGDVRLAFNGRGNEIAGSLSNSGGEVEIAGRVAVSAAGVARLDATLRPGAGIDRDRADLIAAGLALAGTPDGHGGYRLVWPR